eukprot:1505454-Karenia_brevis.AAC.1
MRVCERSSLCLRNNVASDVGLRSDEICSDGDGVGVGVGVGSDVGAYSQQEILFVSFVRVTDRSCVCLRDDVASDVGLSSVEICSDGVGVGVGVG